MQTSAHSAGPSPPALVSWMGLVNGFKQRQHSCSQLFYSIRPIQHWEFADCISKLVDNYFSTSIIPAGRIYSQYTACSITLIHSFSSFFPPLPPSLFLSQHENFTYMKSRDKLNWKCEHQVSKANIAKQCHTVKVTDFLNSSPPMPHCCRLFPCKLRKREALLLNKLHFYWVIILTTGSIFSGTSSLSRQIASSRPKSASLQTRAPASLPHSWAGNSPCA